MGTIAEKGEYLNNTKLLLKQKINNLGGSIDEQTTFREYTDELQDIYDNLPKATGEGTEVSLNTVKGRMQITEKGNTIQDGTPTPDNEVPIKVVTGENTVTISGKNLFDKDNANVLNNTLLNGTNGTISGFNGCKTLYILIKNNTTYTVSKILSARFVVGTCSSIPAINVVCGVYSANNTGTSITITSGANDKYLCVFYYLSGTDTITEQEILNSIQIEKGSTATPFEPYISPISKQLDLGDLEFAKIGTVNDVLFHAVSGDKYYDSLSAEDKALLDVGDWYKHEKINKYTFTGTEGWQLRNTTTEGTKTYSAANIPNNYKLEESANISNGYCNALISMGTTSGAAEMWTNVLFKNKIGFTLYYLQSYPSRNIYVNTTADLPSYLANNTVVIYYMLETPVFTKITNTTLISQLEEIDNLMSNNGTTIISTSCEEGNALMILDVTAIGTDATQPTGTISITTNGSHNVTNYATANVNVTPATETKTVKSTTTSQTINPTSGKLISQITVTPITLDTVNVTPSTSSQTVTPTHDGIGTVNVSAVTSSIDNNIVAGNIKKDISILGVTGTYEGGGSTNEWSSIGYSAEPPTITEDRLYSKSLYDNWTSTSKFTNDTQLVYAPLVDLSDRTSMVTMFSGCSNLVYVPQIDTSSSTSFQQTFKDCKRLKTLPSIDTSKATTLNNLCNSCSLLENFPVLDFSSVTTTSTALTNMVSSCSNLTNESLNNIMASLLTATGYTGTKTLKIIGLTSTQATTCTSLSNWTALSTAGWTTGY